jgi:hypothetical protein
MINLNLDKERIRQAINKESFYRSELPDLKINGAGIGKALLGRFE